MEIRLTLKPGQKGTKKLVAEYGERLVCVRYRYDEARRKRFKTVELIVEEQEWLSAGARYGVRVEWGEIDLARRGVGWAAEGVAGRSGNGYGVGAGSAGNRSLHVDVIGI